MISFFKRRYFVWISILGLSISIVGALEPVIQIANIFKYILDHWHELTGLIWNWFFHLFGLQADAGVVALLNAGSFCFALEICAVFAPKHISSIKSICLIIINRVVITLAFLGILISAFIRSNENFRQIPDPFKLENWQDEKNWLPLGAWVFAMMFLQGPSGNPFVLAKRLLDVAILVLVVVAFSYVSIYAPIARNWIASF